MPPQTGSFRPGSRCEPGTEGEDKVLTPAPFRVLRYCAFDGYWISLDEIDRMLNPDDLEQPVTARIFCARPR